MSAALRTCKGLWTVDTHEALAQGARAKKQSREMGECGSWSWAYRTSIRFPEAVLMRAGDSLQVAETYSQLNALTVVILLSEFGDTKSTVTLLLSVKFLSGMNAL